MSKPIRVLFVCLGNICRSATAEGILRNMVKTHDLQGRIEVDSAGTGSYHIGEKPNKSAMAVAKSQGIDLSAQRARQVKVDDFDKFDHILAMDLNNLKSVRELAPPGHSANVQLLLTYHPDKNTTAEVPDPFYGDKQVFVDVYNLIDEACLGFLGELNHNAGA